jgi:2,3,4,5-tetrahydropyridine-2-carboxylate N-succinyltransferase
MNKKWIDIINNAWEDRALLDNKTTKETIRNIIEEVDKGRVRVAYQENNKWIVNDWVKKAIILYFPIHEM